LPALSPNPVPVVFAILSALPQRWDRDGQVAEPVEKVGVEALPQFGHGQVGCADQLDIGSFLAIAAKRSVATLAILEYANEFALHGFGKVLHFVQEQNPAIRFFHEARPIAGRTCEGTFAVAKEQALCECRVQPAAWDGDNAFDL
jgi:hypothetical protein